MKNLAIGLFIVIVAMACNKEPGVGGTSVITGKINVEDYDQTFSTLWASYDGADMDVYIKYGNSETYGDRVKTGPTGIYEFTYLVKGDYTVYVYSKDSTLQSGSGDIAIMQTVTVSENKQIVTVPTITVFE